MFKRDGSVVHFKHNVKLQASTGANTYVITGKHDEKSIQDLMPGILPHLGPELAQQLQGGMGMGGGGGGMSAPPPSDELGLPSDSDDSDEGSDSEDDVPELVENFDEAQK